MSLWPVLVKNQRVRGLLSNENISKLRSGMRIIYIMVNFKRICMELSSVFRILNGLFTPALHLA